MNIRVILKFKDTLVLRVGVLFFSFGILPSAEELLESESVSLAKKRRILRRLERKKLKSENKALKKGKKKSKKKSKKKPAIAEKHEKKKRNINVLIRMLVRIVGILLKKFAGALRIKAVRVKIVVASDDAAKTALEFAAVSQGLAYLAEALDRVTHFSFGKNDEFSVRPDFTAQASSADVYMIFGIRVFRVIGLAFSALFAYLREPKKASGKRHKASASSVKASENKKAAQCAESGKQG